jgi:hypothetical protein
MTLLVGWLFADLLLGLMMIFLISAPGAASKALICLLTPTISRASGLSSAAPEMVKLQVTRQGGNWYVSRSLVPGIALALQESRLVPAITCPTPTPTSTQTPTPTPNKNALAKDPVSFEFDSNADLLLGGDSGEQARLQGLIKASLIPPEIKPDDRAGIVLSFGTSPDPGEGVRLATAFDAVLQSALPDLFKTTTFRPFHDIGPNRGHISIDVYLFVVGG